MTDPKRTQAPVEARSNTGPTVYHYTRAATALEHILATGNLRLNPIGGTNDPGDAPPFPEITTGADGLDPGVRPYLDAAAGVHMSCGKHKMACFARDVGASTESPGPDADSSRGWARDRMWAQYGDLHRGVCVAFDRERLETASRALARDGVKYVECSDVQYRDDVTYPMWPYPPEAEEDPEVRYRRWERAILPVHFFTKRRDWVHESEFRILIMDYGPKAAPTEDVFFGDAIRYLVVGSKFPDTYRPCIEKACDDFDVPAYRYRLTGRSASVEPYVDIRSDGRPLGLR